METLLGILLTVAAALLIWLVGQAIAWLHQLTGAIRDERLRAMAEMLVAAAEQRFGAGRGDDKYAWVLDVSRMLGLPLTDAHIEAAVRMLQAGGLEVEGEEHTEGPAEPPEQVPEGV